MLYSMKYLADSSKFTFDKMGNIVDSQLDIIDSVGYLHFSNKYLDDSMKYTFDSMKNIVDSMPDISETFELFNEISCRFHEIYFLFNDKYS